ncbi:MAG: hypothetical protein H0U23_15810 [Blastocatellia bacterium]|nr:hypothetical protein [Blastocatellia bacterium]
MTSQFAFLLQEWPELFESASKAEALARSDAHTSCFYARRALELAVHWLYRSNSALKFSHSAFPGELDGGEAPMPDMNWKRTSFRSHRVYRHKYRKLL